MTSNLNPFNEKYREDSLWQQVRRNAEKAGKGVITSVLVLYYCMMDADTPAWAKTMILGALGCFICPTDPIPDFIPGVGFIDDAGVLGCAMSTVIFHIKQEHREKAQDKLKAWF